LTAIFQYRISEFPEIQSSKRNRVNFMTDSKSFELEVNRKKKNKKKKLNQDSLKDTSSIDSCEFQY
jgi:hypothetical protein